MNLINAIMSDPFIYLIFLSLAAISITAYLKFMMARFAFKITSENNQLIRETLHEYLVDLRADIHEKFNEHNILNQNSSNGLRDKLDCLDKNLINQLNIHENGIKLALEKGLDRISSDSTKQLKEIRLIVDEKLQDSLERRLGHSFKQVSDNLEMVHKGLGEMRSLARGVGDLKKVLTNVKTKGNLGEYQLEAILEQILAPSQYIKNARVNPQSSEHVEFSILIPNKNDDQENVHLPIDSKFPTIEYERLQESREQGDRQDILKNETRFFRSIRLFAKDISTKYICPPYTTEFAIMFLPLEGIYAEIVSNTALFIELQSKYKTCVAGPTTLSAFISSLQMGFKTLALEKRSSEVWNILSGTKLEFGKFGLLMEKVSKKLGEAQSVIDQSKIRTKIIEKKLRDVEIDHIIPSLSNSLKHNDDGDDDDDDGKNGNNDGRQQ